MSDEAEMRALAEKFFGAGEAGDIDTLQSCYAPDAVIWHNTDGKEQTREDNAQTLRGFVRRIQNRDYSNRRLHVFPGGFVQMHDLKGTRADGVNLTLPACVVCQVRDGVITRLDEFFDSAHVALFRAEVGPKA